MTEDSRETAAEADQAPSEAEIEARWETADADPDLADDLEYELEELDVLVTSNTDKKVMVLPRAKDWVEEDSYFIADFELACDPIERA